MGLEGTKKDLLSGYDFWRRVVWRAAACFQEVAISHNIGQPWRQSQLNDARKEKKGWALCELIRIDINSWDACRQCKFKRE